MAISENESAPDTESAEIPFTEDTQPLDTADIPSPKSTTRARKKSTPSKGDPSKPGQAVSGAPRDPVVFSRAVPESEAKTRKSLTVHHLQRRLTDLGYVEANSDINGRYGALTARSVEQWQADHGYESTGRLTPEQFAELFKGDPNVTVVFG